MITVYRGWSDKFQHPHISHITGRRLMAAESARGIVTLFRADADGQGMFGVTVFDDICDVWDGDAPARLVAVMNELPAHLAEPAHV